ncbi:receptor-interacting serine/threonine-protein kinase 2-like [Spea bombifrons]|uniref:receptor-interacting serine/threonine-protein kinase 2-like n=1 Tax=Spea bombifrons TaxID=233779 RepID=UPI00234A82A0|nr:receptor-interacting serine/threonine-protein kinase 2-like [Spea bombifrons]
MSNSQPLVVDLNVRTFQLVQTSSELAPRVSYGRDGSYAFLKLFPSDGLSTRAFEGILSHVEKLRQIKSQRLAQIFGVYQTPNTFGILTDWMPNGSLHSLIYQRDQYSILPFRVCIRILVDVAEGLHHLHSLSPPVAHQALKPCNILMDEQYRAKVSDFGLASVRSAVSTSDDPSHKHRVYLSPERLQGEGPSVADDIYSFGMICWEMFSRQPPFHDNDNPLKLETCITRGLRPQPDMNTLLTARGISPAHRAPLMELVSCCWHLEPHIRPSMRRCLDHLQTILQTIPAEAMDSSVDFLQSKRTTAQNQPLEFSMKSLALSMTSNSSRNRACSEPTAGSTNSLNSTARCKDQRSATLPCLPLRQPVQASGHLPLAISPKSSEAPRPQQRKASWTNNCSSQMPTSGPFRHHVENGYFTRMLITNREKILNCLTEGRLNHLLDKLRSSRIFCSADCEDVEANKTLTNKARMCLDICHQKGEEASMFLLQILRSFNVCLEPRNPA